MAPVGNEGLSSSSSLRLAHYDQGVGFFELLAVSTREFLDSAVD